MDPTTAKGEDVALATLNAEGVQSSPSNFKELVVNSDGLKNLKLHPAGAESALLYVVNSLWTPGKPGVSLHAGADENGPVLGVVHFGTLGRENKVGLGDPSSDLNAVVWEKLSKVNKLALSRYTFDFLFGEYGRKPFLWRRTQYFPFGGKIDFQLVEVDNPDVVLAEYIGEGLLSWKKRGTLRIREGYGDAWELMVVLTILAIVERTRRVGRSQRNQPF